MNILVIDVAAEHSGALSILNQFIEEFEQDTENEYYVVLSTLHYEDRKNVKFINCEWAKKSMVHRLYFDNIYAKRLVDKIKPDKVFSLQNKIVAAGNIPQDVYFQNALGIADKKFTLSESKYLWFYQNVIGNLTKHSLKHAKTVYVQAEWIKKTLVNKWGIDNDCVIVKRPKVESMYEDMEPGDENVTQLFYPANTQIYKNHFTLLKALKEIWDEDNGSHAISLVLTCTEDQLSEECLAVISSGDYPIKYVGHLSKNEMIKCYKQSILVFPSYLETVGLPLIEAKQLGRRIIAADLPYAHETLENYDEVSFVNPFGSKDIKRTILNAIRIQ